MAGPGSFSPTINSWHELVSYFEQGNKAVGDWRIGTEHEKFAYHLDNLRPLNYSGKVGIRAVLESLQRFGWSPVFEGEHIIALSLNGQAVSLEPSGAVELSGAPLFNLQSHLVRASFIQFSWRLEPCSTGRTMPDCKDSSQWHRCVFTIFGDGCALY